jgi:hypothetical protein
MCKKYGAIEPPKDIKLPGTPITDGELLYPDVNSLPTDEPIIRYEGGDCNLALARTLKFLLNPFVKNNYYYEIKIPTKSFMEYAVSIDGSPNTIIVAIMYKAMTRFLKEKEGTFISGRIAADYRDDIGASESYRDFVRFIHVKYQWNMKDESIKKLNMRARGAAISQNQPELSYERFRRLEKAHKLIDEQPTLKEKIKCAAQNSTYRNDPRDPFTISYVGQIDLGGMEQHIKSIYNITDGDLMLEVNALKDNFDISWASHVTSSLEAKNDAEKSCLDHIFENKIDNKGNRILNQEEIEALYDLINKCYENGYTPIIVIPPYLSEYTNEIKNKYPDFLDSFYSLLEGIIAETGVSFYDYGFDSRFVSNYAWFLDSDHLNKEGARHFVNILIDEAVH